MIYVCAKKDEKSNENFKEKITVLLPFRNEQNNIGACVQSILNQNTDFDFELILIDDHSEDDYIGEIPKSENLTLLYLNENETGKKEALNKGVIVANGDIIITTDADCIVPSDWIHTIAKNFSNPITQMSIGNVKVQDNSKFIQLLQSSESLILGLFTKYGVFSNSPLLASGANLAFRKKAFQDVKGFFGNETISSGDDMFLLEKIRKHFGSESIAFHNVESVTNSVSSFKEFLNQRVRWYKKMSYIKELRTTHFSFFISGINTLLFLSILSPKYYSIELLFILITKYLIDFYLLSKTKGVSKKHLLFSPLFFIWNLVYPLILLVAMLFLKPKWKGRKIA